MGILSKMVVIANSGLSRYSQEHLSEQEKKAIQEFVNTHQDEIKYGCIRDNCGVIAADFRDWIENNYQDFKVSRESGYFKLDKPMLSYGDFHKEEFKQMRETGLDPFNDEDRKSYFDSLDPKLQKDFYRLPHYWNLLNGKIIDFSVYSQVIKTGLAGDSSKSRYSKSFR